MRLITSPQDDFEVSPKRKNEETIEHLFWNCEIVQAFIDEMDSWLLSNGGSIPFTMQFFLFGDTSKSS
jgi:hypothetical protein